MLHSLLLSASSAYSWTGSKILGGFAGSCLFFREQKNGSVWTCGPIYETNNWSTQGSGYLPPYNCTIFMQRVFILECVVDSKALELMCEVWSEWRCLLIYNFLLSHVSHEQRSLLLLFNIQYSLLYFFRMLNFAWPSPWERVVSFLVHTYCDVRACCVMIRGRPLIIWGERGEDFCRIIFFLSASLWFQLLSQFFFLGDLLNQFFFAIFTTPPQMINGRPLSRWHCSGPF